MSVVMEAVLAPERLVTDYLAYLGVKKGRPRCRGHLNNVRQRLGRMLEGVERIEDVTPELIEAKLVELLQEEVRIGSEIRHRTRQTVDNYRRELGTFFRWIVRKRRLVAVNPLDQVDSLEHEDQRRVTRPFSPAEARQFFAAVPDERLALYALWATCGLRPGETRRLLVGHVVLAPVDGSPPYLQILRATSKNRKAVRQPLHPHALRLIVPLIEGRCTEEPVFRAVSHWKTFRRDLERAGLPVAPGPEGVLTRTSLRKLFATSLDRQGASEGMVQKLMRHSTPELTRERYTHFDLTEKAAAVSRLGFLACGRPEPGGRLVDVVERFKESTPDMHHTLVTALRALARLEVPTFEQLTDERVWAFIRREGLTERPRARLLRAVNRLRRWMRAQSVPPAAEVSP